MSLEEKLSYKKELTAVVINPDGTKRTYVLYSDFKKETLLSRVKRVLSKVIHT